jgi:uncharacterized protein (TIGR02466 family)
MNDHIEVVPIFPTPLYFAICNDDIESSIKYMEECTIDVEKDLEIQENYGTISLDTYILDKPECAPLKNWIMGHVDNYAKNVLAWTFNEISMTQSWVSIKSEGERHTYHKHPNSLISGVFYWHEEEIEAISFMKPPAPTNFDIVRDESKTNEAPFAFDYRNFTPLKNTLILFPSYMQHGVPKNSSPMPRKSVAFNTFIFETIGLNSELTELKLK